MKNKHNNIKAGYSIQKKLLLVFAITSIFSFAVNLMLYWQVNQSIQEIDQVYSSNVSTNELSDTLTAVYNSSYSFLNVRSSESLENYYRSAETLQGLTDKLNDRNTDNEMLLLEKNIRSMSEQFINKTGDAISFKRGRNIAKYKEAYEESQKLYQYINGQIYKLNNLQLTNNSNTYEMLVSSLRYLEIISLATLIIVSVINILVLLLTIGSIISPLKDLARAAEQVGKGNFEVGVVNYDSQDEIGSVSRAFNQMVIRLRDYMIQIKESVEKELLMETHLKDAQLKYLQAQINPHFLFNSLNAGAQLAMMEDAEKTSVFLEKMADFFRYNVKKGTEAATLEEEINAVDNYIYILNVRFDGDIGYKKIISEDILKEEIPSMILQPIVENAVTHGIRGVSWHGMIELRAERYEGKIRIRVRDNGVGMTKEQIDQIMNHEYVTKEDNPVSTGIGLDNVISRLDLFYDHKNVFTITSDGKDKGTEVTIYV